MLEEIEITLRGKNGEHHNIWIDVADNSLSRKWLRALNQLLITNKHLEKNYCWFGWTEHGRTARYICEQINFSIVHINESELDYHIDCEPYTVDNVIAPDGDVEHDRMNWLHRWFEDLQGWSGGMSNHYNAADPTTRWHIRQLNLLCHELESLVLSMRKEATAPEWRRPSQLMCWLNAPRFILEERSEEHTSELQSH